MDNCPPGPHAISSTRPAQGPITVTRQADSTMHKGEVVLFREPVPRPLFLDRLPPKTTNRVSPEYGPWTEGTILSLSQHGLTITHNTRQVNSLYDKFTYVDEDHYADQIRRFNYVQPDTTGIYDI